MTIDTVKADNQTLERVLHCRVEMLRAAERDGRPIGTTLPGLIAVERDATHEGSTTGFMLLTNSNGRRRYFDVSVEQTKANGDTLCKYALTSAFACEWVLRGSLSGGGLQVMESITFRSGLVEMTANGEEGSLDLARYRSAVK